MRRAVLLGVLAAAAVSPAAADQTQDPAAVAAAVHEAVAATAPADATITVGTVQGASVMPACAAALAVAVNGVQPYEQATVHCPAPGWTLYVAVTVAATQMVEVAARPIAAGASLAPEDFRLQREPVAAYAGRQVYYAPDDLIGATAAMNLPAGAILTATALQAPMLVRAGQTTMVTVISGGVSVTVNAVADEAGRRGDTILMTNPSSGQRFHALVTAQGPVVRLQ
jgi:flagella basal body P-ring formation protein FlgA